MTGARWRYLTALLWLLALSLAAWTLWQLPLGNILSSLGLLGWNDWLLWLTVNIIILYLAVKRWQLLGLALEAPLSLTRLFTLRQAGSAVSFLTPGPHFGGEPLQLYWLCRHCHLPLHRAVAMLGLDRFMETGTNIAVLLGGVLLLLGTTILPVGEWLQISAILAALLSALLVAALLVLRHPAWLAARFRPLAQRWRRRGEPEDTESGWLALVDLLRRALSNHRPRLWMALLLSVGGWGALLIELVLLLHFLGVSPTVTDIVVIMVGMRLAMLLPVPGGIGTIEASLLWSFRLLGLPVSAAAGLIALIRLRDALVLLIGLGCLASFQGQRTQSARSDIYN
ncbi:MAG: lysylphosphatidylglycerol synthase transmembrane domain-containing protein [Pseudohongiellaceae bacterium]